MHSTALLHTHTHTLTGLEENSKICQVPAISNGTIRVTSFVFMILLTTKFSTLNMYYFCNQGKKGLHFKKLYILTLKYNILELNKRFLKLPKRTGLG